MLSDGNANNLIREVKNMRTFKDIETGEIITLAELEAEYNELFASGETETESFTGYLKNCLSKNGTLEEV